MPHALPSFLATPTRPGRSGSCPRPWRPQRRRRVRGRSRPGATLTATLRILLRASASLRPSLHFRVQSFALTRLGLTRLGRFDEITYLVEKPSALTLPAFGRCHRDASPSMLRCFRAKWELSVDSGMSQAFAISRSATPPNPRSPKSLVALQRILSLTSIRVVFAFLVIEPCP